MGLWGQALQALGDAYNTVTYSNYSQDALFATMQADIAAHQQLLFHTSASAHDDGGVACVCHYRSFDGFQWRALRDDLQPVGLLQRARKAIFCRITRGFWWWEMHNCQKKTIVD